MPQNKDAPNWEAIAKEQSDEIKRLREKLEVYMQASLKNEEKNFAFGPKIHDNSTLEQAAKSQKEINGALETHIGETRNARKQFEETTAETQGKRTEQFKAQIGLLRKEGPIKQQLKTLSFHDIPALAEDIDVLRSQAQSLLERLRQQMLLNERLKFELDMERGHVNILKHENKELRETAFAVHQAAELHEESVSNMLLKKIQTLKKEKGDLLQQVEQEEEYLTNALQRKLQQLQKEKIDMEISLEQEQEFMVNRLSKQLDSLRQQQSQSGLNGQKYRNHSPSSSEHNISAFSTNDLMKSEIQNLKARLKEIEHERDFKLYEKDLLINILKTDIVTLRKELGRNVDDIVIEEVKFPTSIERQLSRRSIGSIPKKLSFSGTSQHTMDQLSLSAGPEPTAARKPF